MRTLLLILVALFALPLASAAEPLVGFATISMKGWSPSQPGSCATLATKDERDGCVDFTSWRVYKVRDFVDLKGRKVRIGTMAMASHSRREGMWLLVLQELSPQDQKAYGARYKIVDGSSVLQTACTRQEITTYVPFERDLLAVPADNPMHCYCVHELKAGDDVR
jgi:hypothetical protein